MNLPTCISEIIEPYFSDITFQEEGCWSAKEHSPVWRKTDMTGPIWTSVGEECVKKVAEIGGCLTRYGLSDDIYVDGVRSQLYYILYPAEPQMMRKIIEKSDFGRDDFRSVVDFKHPEPEPNTPARIRARRDEGLKIFDEIAAEAPVRLYSVNSRTFHLNFTTVPNRERADYWAKRVWEFYRNYYAREDPTKVHDTSAYHKKECFRLARKFGSFQIGLLGDS
jgi:hypothetical protein